MHNVLIIDDEEWIRQLIKGLIPWDEYEMGICGEAADGLEALALCRKLRPDIILTDIRMPGMGGLELLEKLKTEVPRAKVIIISGYDEFAYAQKALRLDAFDYLLKPIEEADLAAILLKAKSLIEQEKKTKDHWERLKQEVAKLGNGIGSPDNSPEMSEGSSQHRVIQKALAYIRERYNADLTLEEVAAGLFINPTYFSELFKQEVGTGFTEYLTAIRIEKAKALLRAPEFKVVEIADIVGYRDANYFAKVFKKWTGVTPSEFRDPRTDPKKIR